VTALPGVAIAVALMPPLCTVGFGLGSGVNLEIMGGAVLLFLTNLVAIVASAFLVFLLVGLSTEEVQKVIATSQKDESPARLLSHGPVTRMLAAGGQLHWRVLMLVILLASIAVPLRRALFQVANETLIRGTIQHEMKRLVPSDAIVSQQGNDRPGANRHSFDFHQTYPGCQSDGGASGSHAPARTRRSSVRRCRDEQA
jgi:uncharacterized membrane protein